MMIKPGRGRSLVSHHSRVSVTGRDEVKVLSANINCTLHLHVDVTEFTKLTE